VNRVFEHVVDKVRVRLDKLIKHLELFNLAALFIIEKVEIDFKGVEVHILHRLGQIHLLLRNFLIAVF